MQSRIQKHRQSATRAQQGLCFYCHRPMGKAVTAEHLKARKDGGTDRKDNIVAACRACNHGRHANAECAALSVPAYAFLTLLERASGLRSG